MNSIRLFLFLGIGLSMDTFSLAIIYGSSNNSKRKRLLLSLLVGFFHFFMPIIGYTITKIITQDITNLINTDLVAGIIFLILGIDMFIKDDKKEQNDYSLNIIKSLLFSFSVSLDSFSIGIALGLQKESIILAGIIFALCSFLFTAMGLIIGKKLSEKYQGNINIVGAVILLLIAIKYIIKGI